MQTVTEKMLRRQLGEHFGVDLGHRKAEIRELVRRRRRRRSSSSSSSRRKVVAAVGVVGELQ